MSDYFIKDADFPKFVAKLVESKRVWGPVARKSKFVFAELSAPDELRLDYDVTILPPKKVFFPVRQPLVEFAKSGARSCIDPKEQVLLGVHFYDIKAIDQTDLLFSENHTDNNYMANRLHTTIVGSDIRSVSPRAFWSSVGTDVEPKGHDAFLTGIRGGCHYEARSKRGEALLSFGSFEKASSEQVAQAKRANESVRDKCGEKLPGDAKTMAEQARAAYGNKALWEEMSKECFSCGTCNIVCPTCYCFDVQDRWNLDQVSGVRARSWDGCQLHDFAVVSLGLGATENFREHTFERYRHRYMRKAAYLNAKLGGPACVGCGRCSVGCVPDIADPVKIAERVMEVSR